MRSMGDRHRGNTVLNRIEAEGLTEQATCKQKPKGGRDEPCIQCGKNRTDSAKALRQEYS